MPRISTFYGIDIQMFYNDHAPPHFHAQYAGQLAVIDIATGEIRRGALPLRARRLVGEWLAEHRDELNANWARAQNHEVLQRIAPLP